MMGGTPGAPPDLSNSELVDYRVVEGDGKIRLKLKDGSVIEVTLLIMNVHRVGNDPTTGLPAYAVQSAPVLRLVEYPKELRKPAPRQGNRDAKSITGFG